MAFKLYSIPYYPELVGVPIPGTKRKTQTLHALLFGYISSLDNSEDGCYASKTKIAKRLGTTENVIKDRRADLIKLGWVTVEKNKFGEISRMYAAGVQFCVTPTSNAQIAGVQRTDCYGSNAQIARSTEVRPQSEYKYKNKNIEYAISDEIAASSKSFEDYSSKESETSSNNSVPFDEPVKEMPTRSLRPDKEKKSADAKRRADYAMLGEIRKHFGFAKGSGSPEEKKLLRARLDEGWTKDEIIKVITWIKENREWYKDKPIQVCLASKVFDEYQASNVPPEQTMDKEQLHRWRMTHDEEYREKVMEEYYASK